MALRVWAKAVPMQQWAVGRALKLLTVEILARMDPCRPRTIILKGNDGESAFGPHHTMQMTKAGWCQRARNPRESAE